MRRPIAVLLAVVAACALTAPVSAHAKRPRAAAVAADLVTYPAGAPRGVMLVLHGGGWELTGRDAQLAVQGAALHWAQAGYLAVNADYEPGAASVKTAMAAYRRAARRARENLPVCVHGESAGGHLALLIAARRPRVACAVVRAPVTDLETVTGRVRELAVEFFAPRMRNLSPVAYTDRLHGRVSAAAVVTDEVVPVDQTRALRDRVSGGVWCELHPGDAEFVHQHAEAGQLADCQSRTDLWVAERMAASRARRPAR